MQREQQTSMSKMPEPIRRELEALASQPASDIDCSDMPATSAEDWCGAVRGKFHRPVERQGIDVDMPEQPQQDKPHTRQAR